MLEFNGDLDHFKSMTQCEKEGANTGPELLIYTSFIEGSESVRPIQASPTP